MNSAFNTAGLRLTRHDYGCLLLQLVLLWLVTVCYQLDARHQLPTALGMATVGFAIHALLPSRFQLPWFLLVSLAGLVFVLGPVQAAMVVCLGSVLITIATSPFGFRTQMVLLTAMVAGLVWFRASISLPVWATLGSMFMFRLASYLFCTRQERTTAPRMMTWSYFFLLPNAFFLLFPVVDYTTFCHSNNSSDRRRIYQNGVHWIAIGVGELLLYRLIRSELLPDPLEVRTVRSVAFFLAMNYGLYVYVSGTFHIICGILHLFGFDLPRTHNNYFLASSFTDIWRRINIYWKDFLMKLFFLPAFYALRRGVLLAILLSALWVFFWTWLAHAWQQFWLLGVFPLRGNEAALWAVAGIAVAINAVWDYRGTKRQVANEGRLRLMANGAVHALKVIGVFSCVSIFWGHWTHPEVSQLMVASIVDRVRSPASPAWLSATSLDAVALAAFIVAGMLVGAIAFVARSSLGNRHSSIGQRSWAFDRLSFDATAGLHIAPLVVALLLAQPAVSSLLGTRFSQAVAHLQIEQVTRSEALAAVSGYYEQLSAGSVHAGPFLQAAPSEPGREVYLFGEMTQRRRDILEFDLIPGWTSAFGGAPLTINRWGMRDRDRPLQKPPGVVRIALVGSSVIMGAGVEDHQTFARLLEEQLNAEHGQSGRRFEVLNFGMGKMSAIQRRALIQRRVVKFSPDVILYFAHQDERDAPLERMVTAIRNNVDPEDACLAGLIHSLQLPPETAEALIFAKVNEVLDRVLSCTYAAIADAGRSAGAPVVFIYLPMPSTEETPFQPDLLLSLAKTAGFITADLSTWAEGRSASNVLVSVRDHHPNSRGHELIAARVKQLLLNEPLRIAVDKE